MRYLLPSGTRRVYRQMALGVPVHVAQLPRDAAPAFWADRDGRQRQQPRRRQDQKFRRFDAVESADQVVGQLVVLAAADAVDKQVGQE